MSGSEYLSARKLRRLIGDEAAEIMMEVFGGGRVHVAAKPSRNSRLARAVGLEAAKTLGSHFAVFPEGQRRGGRGCDLEVPLGDGGRQSSHLRRLRAMIENENSGVDIAKELGINERTVRRWRQRLTKSVPSRDASPRLL